ncbi:MAG: hypothetical protein CPSOU_2255 [uncultured Paraburkholderia sp.]|nr:MAG: hypothetical protein CPSOU_2255 [uncultured Paraburkholderia sp.]
MLGETDVHAIQPPEEVALDGNHDFVLGQVRAGLAEFGISLDPGDDEDLIFEPLLANRYVLAMHR